MSMLVVEYKEKKSGHTKIIKKVLEELPALKKKLADDLEEGKILVLDNLRNPTSNPGVSLLDPRFLDEMKPEYATERVISKRTAFRQVDGSHYSYGGNTPSLVSRAFLYGFALERRITLDQLTAALDMWYMEIIIWAVNAKLEWKSQVLGIAIPEQFETAFKERLHSGKKDGVADIYRFLLTGE